MAENTTIQNLVNVSNENTDLRESVSSAAGGEVVEQDNVSVNPSENAEVPPNLDTSKENLNTGVEMKVNTGMPDEMFGDGNVADPFNNFINNMFGNTPFYQPGSESESAAGKENSGDGRLHNFGPAGFGSGGFFGSDTGLEFKW